MQYVLHVRQVVLVYLVLIVITPYREDIDHNYLLVHYHLRNKISKFGIDLNEIEIFSIDRYRLKHNKRISDIN